MMKNNATEEISGIRNGCQVRTSTLKYTYDFSWVIEDCTNWPHDSSNWPHEKLTSPEFHPINNVFFYATLEGKSANSGKVTDKYYGYSDYSPPPTSSRNLTYLTFHLKSDGGMRVQHNVSVTDSFGKRNSWKTSKNFTYSTSEKSCSFLLDRNGIKNYCNVAHPQGVLIFKCAMEIDYLCTEIEEINLKLCQSDNLPVLVDNLKVMYTSSLHTDINLQVGDEVVRVHKSLLCARSPVFAKIFKSPMEENKNNTIAIPDIEVIVLKDLVEFLYTGNLRSDDFETVYALYYAADKYDVSSLRETCAGELLSQMNLKNACRVLSLANRHSNVQLKKSVMDFIQFNFDEIVNTKPWDEFLQTDTKLAAEVMGYRSKMHKKIKDDTVVN